MDSAAPFGKTPLQQRPHPRKPRLDPDQLPDDAAHGEADDHHQERLRPERRLETYEDDGEADGLHHRFIVFFGDPPPEEETHKASGHSYLGGSALRGS